MNTKLRKKLDEAINNYVEEKVSEDTPFFDVIRESTKEDALAGAELGYKEAIKQAKEWIINTYLGDYVTDEFGNGGIGDNVKLVTDFEADMNKLWEGEFDLFIHL